jgi:sarcosine oxidase
LGEGRGRGKLHDVIVIGLGAMGSAAAYQLAKRGRRVLGIDRYAPPHENGSHAGETRITRKAIGEGEAYIPLVFRSHEIWREIEDATGENLLEITGGLWISSAKRVSETHVANFFENTVGAARRFGIPHELLDAEAIRERFPVFKVCDDEQGYYEPDAGFLRSDACIRAQLKLAREHGATLNMDERVTSIAQSNGEVRVTTDRREYTASRAIVSAGAGALDLLPPDMTRHLKVSPQVVYWFESTGHEKVPVWIWELQESKYGLYGFPQLGGLTKIGTETYDVEISPETLYGLATPHLAGIASGCAKTAACLYTCTPDFHFLIDRHPSMDRVIVASPCSGHGFKHSAAIGESLAQWIVDGKPALDLSSFSLSRFSGT